MSVSPLNHAALAQSRIVAQYRNSPRFVTWVGKVCEAFDDLEAVLTVIAKLDDIEALNADDSYVVTGVNLDVVGKRVGQPRRIPGAVPRQLFGWDDDASALAFGEEADERLGGVWYNEGETLNNDAVLDDTTYRVALRARKYLNNLTVVDAIDVYAFLQFVMPEYTSCPMVPFQVFDTGGMSFQIEMRLIPTLLEEILLTQAELMPRPVGVDRPTVTYWDPTVATFGFDDDPNATAAFGEETDSTAGGVFAEEINL